MTNRPILRLSKNETPKPPIPKPVIEKKPAADNQPLYPPPEPGTRRFAAEALMAKRFPKAFAANPPVPLALGIYHALRWEIPELSGGMIARVLERHCHLPEYLTAIIAGGPRYDLRGKRRGEVSPEQIEQAKAKLIELREGTHMPGPRQ